MGKTLRFGKNCRVTDWNHVEGAVKIRRINFEAVNLIFDVLFGQVRRVNPVQNLKTPGHRVVQAGVNAREHDHALLDQGHCGADRLVGVLIAQLLKGSLDDTLTGLHQKAQKLKQRRARRVERHWHGDLADVVNHRAAVHLDHFGRLEVDRLPTRATLELQQGGDVLDVGTIQQCAKGTCSGS